MWNNKLYNTTGKYKWNLDTKYAHDKKTTLRSTNCAKANKKRLEESLHPF